MDIRGSKKLSLREYFASQGGAAAYLGSCMPGFPNFFTLLGMQIGRSYSDKTDEFTGPNVATGHASVIFSQEAQVRMTDPGEPYKLTARRSVWQYN